MSFLPVVMGFGYYLPVFDDYSPNRGFPLIEGELRLLKGLFHEEKVV